jgi:hypothetical protein
MRDEHIMALARRYELDEVAQLVLIVDQLDVCRSLLEEDTIASSRAAIVLLDHHAEILLLRHSESVFAHGDGHGPFRGRTFVSAERDEIRSKFRAKLQVAAGAGALGRDVKPILDADRVAALRLAHEHRNAAYHGDLHNPAVLRLVCLLEFEAVCHLLAATTSGLTIGGASRDERIAGLERHGVRPATTYGLRDAVCLSDAARVVADSLTTDLHLPRPAIQAELALDLLDRTGSIFGVIDELIEDGIEPWRIEFVLAHAEFCAAHLADPELCALARRSDAWERRAEADEVGRLPDVVSADMAAANDERNARWIELQRAFRPRATLANVARTVEQVQKLVETSSLAHTLDLYRRLDADLQPVERHLPECVRSWDEMVQRQIDTSRGK